MKYTYTGSGRTVLSNGDIDIVCGFEMGDWLSYVSAGRDETNADHRVTDEAIDDEVVSVAQRVNLRDGSFQVDQSEEISGSGINRFFTVSPDRTGPLGDFVVRFAVPASEDMVAAIGGRVFEHEGRNRYFQFRDDTAELRGDSARIVFETVAADLPEGMPLVTYVRDEPPDTWVVHARAIAAGTDDGVLRFYRGDTTHVPLLDRVVTRFDWLADPLRYLRERSRVPSALIPVQYCERAQLSDGDTLQMNVEARFEE